MTILSDINSNGSVRTCTGIDDNFSLGTDGINLTQLGVAPETDQKSVPVPAQPLLSVEAETKQEESQFFMNSADFQSRMNAFKEEFKDVEPELIVKHPLVYPDDFGTYKSKDSFGSPNARPIIIDGSNVEFGKIFT